MAINGNGFFTVATGNGTAYTRAGNFIRNEKGQIVTAAGNVVIGQNSVGNNAGSLNAETARAIAELRPDRLVVTEPGEWRLALEMEGWSERLALPVERREDDRFLCSRDTFERWAKGRKELRMEFFYRLMRRQTGWLMEGDDPEGG